MLTLKLQVRSWVWNTCNSVFYSQLNRKIYFGWSASLLSSAVPSLLPPSSICPCGTVTTTELPCLAGERLGVKASLNVTQAFLVFCSLVAAFTCHTELIVKCINQNIFFSLSKMIYFQLLFCSTQLSQVPGTLNLFYWISLCCYNLENSAVQGCIIVCEW